jgi:sulfatase maturation enzyme AslB (radical SAM superfamily)
MPLEACEPRLRAIHPLVDDDGSCTHVYDLERTLIIDVEPELRGVLHTALNAGPLGGAAVAWLRDRDLLTSSPPVSWAEGATPTLPQVADVSLDMSGTCNMGCTYCFKDDTAFGSSATTRTRSSARSKRERSGS